MHDPGDRAARRHGDHRHGQSDRVTGQALAISLGTGNTLFEIGTATFAKEWVIFVTDADGNAVASKPVQVSIRSVNFQKGNLYVPTGRRCLDQGARCADEFEPT